MVLPNATTCKIGLQYEIDNNSTGAVALQANGATLLWTLAPGADVRVILTANGTAAGTWNIDYFGNNVATTKVETFNNSFTFAGTDASTVNFPAAGGTIYVASNPATAVGDLIAGNSAATPAVLTRRDRREQFYRELGRRRFRLIHPGLWPLLGLPQQTGLRLMARTGSPLPVILSALARRLKMILPALARK